jgi:hypothetical protein
MVDVFGAVVGMKAEDLKGKLPSSGSMTGNR